MVTQAESLQSLLAALPLNADKETLDSLVSKALEETRSSSSPENRRAQWEFLIKNDIFSVAMQEAQALRDKDDNYYDRLRDRLHLALVFTEHDAVEASFPFIILQDLLETLTIPSCSHIFSFIESHATRLTINMAPQKGKALILLRMLNDLLRRLSKVGGKSTSFSGRILCFLSSVFPIGERSGVNLRGEYGPVWEGPGGLGERVRMKEEKEREERERAQMEIDKKEEQAKTERKEEDEMRVDEEQKKAEEKAQAEGAQQAKSDEKEQEKKVDKKDDFYHTFWSLQLPFSRPPVFAQPQLYPFADFRSAVNKVLPAIREANSRERALLGSAGAAGKGSGSGKDGQAVAAGTKRKREEEGLGEGKEDYFFAKFLTSPELLDLEIADTHFRRQILLQLLILLNHLLTFTKPSKAAWATHRNRSLHMDFTLSTEDRNWVQETLSRAQEELKGTGPGGRIFAEMTSAVLEREKGWVDWKNDLCPQFDKPVWGVEVDDGEEIVGEEVRKKKRKISLEEATKAERESWKAFEVEEWEYSMGSKGLTDVWDWGYQSLEDLKRPFQPGDVKDFVKKITFEDRKIEMRKKQLAAKAERLAQLRAKAEASKSASGSPAPAPAASTSTPPPTQPKESTAPPTPAPAPVATASSPPLHPSLPPKPGTAPAPVNGEKEKEKEKSPVKEDRSKENGKEKKKKKPEEPVDPEIASLNENKWLWCWLALRVARETHLRHFLPLGGRGDVTILQAEIEKEARGGGRSRSGHDGGLQALRSSSPGEAVSEGEKEKEQEKEKVAERDGDGDVKME